MIRFFLAAVMFNFFLNVYSQKNESDHGLAKNSFDLKILGGKLVEIYPDFPMSKLSTCFELDYNYQTSGDKLWNYILNYPKIGLSAVFTDFGNNKILGQSLALYPHLSIYKPTHSKLKYNFKFGLGIAYFNNPFNAVDNKNNFVIGSKFTSIVSGQFNLYLPIKNNIYLSTGLFFYHYSNGHIKVPNVGANVVGLSIGARIEQKKNVEISTNQYNTNFESKLKFGASFGIGTHELEGGIKYTGGSKYPVYTSSFYATTKIGSLSKLGTGFEVNYHALYHDNIINQQIFRKYQKLKSSALIYFVSYELLLARLALMWQAGLNVYNPYNVEANKIDLTHRNGLQLYMANKFGFRYYLKSQDSPKLTTSPYIGLNIKTQGLVAHFVEFQIGYLF